MIKVINGTVGVYDGARLILMTSKSEAFTLSKERMASLVATGIAEYVGQAATPAQSPAADKPPTSPTGLPKYDATMKLEELKAIAKAYGVDAKSMISKAQVVTAINTSKAAIKAALEASEQDDDGDTDEDDNQLPNMDAADPV